MASNNTIEITGGITQRTSRLALKRAMAGFGEVDACHMGDRAVMGDNFTEFPIVRFKSQSVAETALNAIKTGQVFLDGQLIQAEWRGGGGLAVRGRLKGPQATRPPIEPQPGVDETSSRMLLDQGGGRDRHRNDHRDARRNEDHSGGGGGSSRRLFDAAGGGRGSGAGGGGGGGRSRSRSRRRRGRSRRRRRSRSRSKSRSKSKSAKKGRAASPGPLSGAAAVSRSALMFLTKAGEVEPQLAMSENPLFVGGK
mmetsp:Transcript_29243/g.44176  ORF Transcript_29243/g.44176 Transcript_29243/m.44176 type:complete len:253 (+) Transcript_29243:184-942(+)